MCYALLDVYAEYGKKELEKMYAYNKKAELTGEVTIKVNICRNIDSDFNLVNSIKIANLTYAIIDLFILQAWVSLHTELKSANLKSHQQCFLSKPPNIMFANISAYTVY